MNKAKDRPNPQKQSVQMDQKSSPKPNNNYKALYQLTKQRRIQNTPPTTPSNNNNSHTNINTNTNTKLISNSNNDRHQFETPPSSSNIQRASIDVNVTEYAGNYKQHNHAYENKNGNHNANNYMHHNGSNYCLVSPAVNRDKYQTNVPIRDKEISRIDKERQRQRQRQRQLDKFEGDSLDQIQEEATQPVKQFKRTKQKKDSDNKCLDAANKLNRKKWSHSRSQSCPFMNPQAHHKIEQKHPPPYYTKFVLQNQSKRTLKKSSTLHRKNNRLAHKSSISQNSQLSHSSNTVIVHSLPIQHLSSMLYSSHRQESFPSFKRLSNVSSQQISGVDGWASGVYQCQPDLKVSHNTAAGGYWQGNHSLKDNGIQNRFMYKKSPVTQHVFAIDGDVYFQTKIQQLIKMYDLSEEMQKLKAETENVKIKQEVLEKLGSKIGKMDGQDGYTDQEDSLYIH